MTLHLEQLAQAKRLPVAFLAGLGLHDRPDGVGIPYRDAHGQEAALKRRIALEARQGSRWPSGQRLMPYGRERLGDARQAGFLIVVEGESDCWTLWYHGLPALGLPGASTTGHLAAEDLEGVGALYVHVEPGRSGETFLLGLTKRLAMLGFQGHAWSFSTPGAKDPSALHCAGPDNFKALMEAAIRDSQPLALPGDAWLPAEIKMEPEEPAIPSWPDPPAPAAYAGVAGDIVRAIEPETEADPVAILVQLLVAFGNAVGRTAFRPVGPRRHYGNLFACLVGSTSVGRKGTSWSWVESLLAQVDPNWARDSVLCGLSSGEGLIAALRDDLGSDRRLMAVEEEFGAVLRAAARDGSILSAVLRQAWDGGRLRVMTRHNPLVASDCHVSIVGHVTPPELRRLLSECETANGFANRFLWVACRRSKLLPDGGELVDLGPFSMRLERALEEGRLLQMLPRERQARILWHEQYGWLTSDTPGALGLVTSRAAPQCLRLSVLYSLLDCCREVRSCHLQSALALWDYCRRSAAWIFGDSTGDPDADQLLEALRRAPAGLNLTEMAAVFGRHKSGPELRKLLAQMEEWGLVIPGQAASCGKASRPWRIANPANPANPSKNGAH